MTGQIPKYGKNFRLDHVERDFDNDLARSIYVLKADGRYYIRSNGNSERWTIFVTGPANVHVPLGKPFNTLTEAMAALLPIAEILGVIA